MLICKAKKWGNSLGLIIPKSEVKRLGLVENEEIIVNIIRDDNPLKELWGFSKEKISRKEFLDSRKELDSKWI